MARSSFLDIDDPFDDFDDLHSQHEVLGGVMCCTLRNRRSHPRNNHFHLNLGINVASPIAVVLT